MTSLYKLTVGEEQEFRRVLADGGFTAELAKRLIRSPFLVHNFLVTLFNEGVPEAEEQFEDDNPELEGETIKFIVEGVRVEFLLNEEWTLREAITETVGRSFKKAPIVLHKALKELYYGNDEFQLYRDPQVIFRSAETPHAFLFDTVSEVIRQVLLLDPEIRKENFRRQELQELKRKVWRHSLEYPRVKPITPGHATCHFQWWMGGADGGSMLEPYCMAEAQVKLCYEEEARRGEELRCMDHAIWDVADRFLELEGTSREDNAPTPEPLKKCIRQWVEERLDRER